jgi:hypothetical protein
MDLVSTPIRLGLTAAGGVVPYEDPSAVSLYAAPGAMVPREVLEALKQADQPEDKQADRLPDKQAPKPANKSKHRKG